MRSSAVATPESVSRVPQDGVATLETKGIILLGLPAADAARVRGLSRELTYMSLDDKLSESARIQVMCAVVDPAWVAETSPDGQWQERLREVDVPCIFLTDSSPHGFRTALGAAEVTPYRLLLRGVDDDTATLHAAIAEARPFAHAERLLAAIAPALAGLSGPVRSACERLVYRPERFFDAADLARASLLSRRHLDRTLHEQGLGTAKQLVIGARVWQAYRLITAEPASARGVAARLGYADGKSLLRHVRAVLGEQHSSFKESSAAEDVLKAVAAFMTR